MSKESKYLIKKDTICTKYRLRDMRLNLQIGRPQDILPVHLWSNETHSAFKTVEVLIPSTLSVSLMML